MLFNTTFVPVGLDQKQHVEMTKDIAKSFNHRYGETFIVPKELIKEEVKTVLGIDGRKMSKSYDNTIQLFSSPEILKKRIFSIITDSSLPTDPKPTSHQLFEIYKLFATSEEIKFFEEKFKRGIGWGEIKREVFEKANEYLTPLRNKYNEIIAKPEYIDKILKNGSAKAREIAKNTLARVRKAIGV